MTAIRQQVFGVVLLLSVALLTQAEHLPVKIYTSADGLGSSFVDYIMRDSRGFMWFCTRDGLSRFDGSRFITYRLGVQNGPPGIEAITETRGGIYWITTTIGTYRVRANELAVPAATIANDTPLKAELVSDYRGPILEDHAGNIWWGTDDLYIVRDLNGRLEREQQPLNLPADVAAGLIVLRLSEAPDRSIWICTNRGLIRRLADGRLILYRQDRFAGAGLVAMLIDARGRVWEVWGAELFVINPPALDTLGGAGLITAQPLPQTAGSEIESARDITLPEKAGDGLRLTRRANAETFRDVYQTLDGHIWITATDSLFEFDGRVFHSYDQADGLPAGMIRLGEDDGRNLWVGGRNLVRLNRTGLTSFGTPDGLNSASLFTINEAPYGSLYFANGDFYVSKLEGERFTSSRPLLDSHPQPLWSSHYAFLSQENEWWFLTNHKLYRYGAASLRTPIATYDQRDGFKIDRMFQIFEDSRGDIWVSQQGLDSIDSGLYRLRRGESRFAAFTAAEGFPPEKSAASFAEDRNGDVWIGFYEGGLARFAHDRFVEFSSNGAPEGLITDLHFDRQGRLWLSSSLAGLSRIDNPQSEQPSFIPITSAAGLASNNVRTITEDNFGNIYAGTARGVDRISPDLKHITHYSVSDGLAADFVLDSFCDRNGVLWFATTDGLSKLIPQNGETVNPPPIWLGGVRIAGVPQAVSILGEATLRSPSLSAAQNNLQIDFFGIDFRPGDRLRYQWMLEGADANWTPPAEQQTVSYANLSPGTYRFLVRAVTSDGLASPQPAVLSFRILRPFWQRWWFLAISALALLGAGFSLHRYRVNRLLAVERVRTRIATDLHDDIGASLSRIAILSEAIKQQRGEANAASSSMLAQIAESAREAVDSMSDIVWSINPRRDDFANVVARVRQFAAELLEAQHIDWTLNSSTETENITLPLEQRRDVFLICKEAINNVARHAQCAHVTIDFAAGDHRLEISITDDGRGFVVNAEDQQLKTIGGHGLASMRARAERLHGDFSITSAPAKGSRIILRLPLRRLRGGLI